MQPNEVIPKELEQALHEAVESFKTELQGVRSGRPSTQLLENIQVSYFDQMVPIKQLGSLSITPPREIDVMVWDPTAVNAVAKAIESAKIGLTANVDGNTIRCFLPPLTSERREELGKVVKKLAEEYRIRIRSNRDDANKKIKAAEGEKTLTEDMAFKTKERIQKLVDDANKKVEDALSQKIAELAE